jgi:predicted flap endonuclease-1-like 5' DNA nuclease
MTNNWFADPNWLWWFLFGAFLAVVAALIWDWLFYDRNRTKLTEQINTNRTESANWQKKFEAANTELGSFKSISERSKVRVNELESELSKLRAQFDTDSSKAQANIARLEGETRNWNIRLEKEKRDLQSQWDADRKAWELKLNDAQTANQRYKADLDAANVRLGDFNRRGSLESDLQAKLQALQTQLDSSNTEKSRLTADAVQLQSELAAVKADLEACRGRSRQLEVDLGDVRKNLMNAPTSTAGEGVHGLLSEAKAEIVRLTAMLGRPAAPVTDRLVDILGIGPVYESRLHSAGVFTFEQLIETPIDKIRQIVKLKEWQDVDVADWHKQAQAFIAKRQSNQ